MKIETVQFKFWSRRAVQLAAFVSLLFLSAAFADDSASVLNTNVDLTAIPLDDLLGYKVQGASKYEQRLSEAPSSVTIIDSDEIKKYGHRNLAEVLRSVRSLYVSYDRNYSYLGVRGFNRPGDYTSRVLVLVDGHRINENVFDSVLIGHDFPLDVDTIDRIEIIRGPSSSIYGNNAFFGVINVLTKRGRDVNGWEVSSSYGSFDSYKGRVSYGKLFSNEVELFLSGSYYDSAGADRLRYAEYNTPSNNINHGITRNTDYEKYYKAFGSLSYKDFTAEAEFSSREKGVPTGSYGTLFNDSRTKTTDNRAYLDLKYQHTFEHDWQILARLAYDNYYYYGDYAVDYPPPALYKDYAYGNWWSSELQVNKKLFDRHTLTFGAEIRDNFNQDQGSEDPYTKFDDRRSNRNFGLFGQGEILILTNLILNAGIRYDHYETLGDAVNPRLALIYNPWDATTFKALYGTAFKGPNAYELYYSAPGNKGNTSLQPENITTYEMVYEQGIGKHLNFIATGFYYEIDHLINQQEDPADGLLVYRNLNQVSAKGVELELDAKFPCGLRGRTSYSYQDTRDEATGKELSNSPHHQVKFNLIAPILKDRLFSGVELQYSSGAKTLQGNVADGFWVANLTLSWQPLPKNKNLDVSASIYNLFDAKYDFPGNGEHIQDKLTQDGRTFRVKVTYHF